MYTFVIKITDLNFEITCKEAFTKNICKDYFSCEEPDFKISITEDDVAYERSKSEPNDHFSYGYLESLATYRKICEIIPSHGSFLIHGASIAVNHKAFLFTARSGVGKSTHIALWLKNIPGTYVVNGDKPIITVKNEILISGTPWCGKESLNQNITEPLKAIIFVNRAEQNSIKKITPGEAFIRLYHQIYKPNDGKIMEKTVKLIEKTVNSVAFFDLFCNMEDEAAFVAAEELLKL